MNAVKERTLIDFLSAHGAKNQQHTGRPFLEHLVGVQNILRSWGCAEDTCVGGLFHSVYGTNAFKSALIDKSLRRDVRKLIGFHAESLAYIFCAVDRPRALLDLLNGKTLINRISGKPIVVSDNVHLKLIEIECANLIEQGAKSTFLKNILVACEVKKIILNAKIAAALRALDDSGTGQPRLDTRLQIVAPHPSDIDDMTEIARHAHVDSRYAWSRFEENQGRKVLLEILTNPAAFIRIARRRGDVVGFIYAELRNIPFTKSKIAVCEYIYVLPRQRGLVGLRLFIELKIWAKSLGVAELRIVDTAGEDSTRADRYFRKIGLKHVGGSFSLWM